MVTSLYPADRPSGDESANPPQLRLLVVDDYPPGLMLLQQQFSFLGYRVVGAADGEAALAQWFAGDVDVVITDSRMPVMDGCALTEAIRQAERAEVGAAVPDYRVHRKRRCGGAGAMPGGRDG